jgi:hypothetical protein
MKFLPWARVSPRVRALAVLITKSGEHGQAR